VPLDVLAVHLGPSLDCAASPAGFELDLEAVGLGLLADLLAASLGSLAEGLDPLEGSHSVRCMRLRRLRGLSRFGWKRGLRPRAVSR
jgi:hypothetical protein